MARQTDQNMDHRTSQIAETVIGHQETESAAPAHTPLPWKLCNGGECPCLMISCPDHPIAKVESGEWGDEYPAMRQVGASLENKYEAYMERIAYGSIDRETARANAELIVKAVNTYASNTAELLAAYEQIKKLEAALDECIDYFEDRADADCDQDGYIPNDEMKMLGRINETLHGPGAF